MHNAAELLYPYVIGYVVVVCIIPLFIHINIAINF